MVTSTNPIVSSYNDRIRPLLNIIDELRQLDIMNEGITLPTIVVVGDQSHGKSSVLESLAAISLPRGQSLCTRVPLITRMVNHSDPVPQFHLEYLNKTFPTSEDSIPSAIELATKEIAGDGTGVSGVPLTLVIRKDGVPDLTMVDLPGIVRVPVDGQPKDICDQIQNIIMEYIKPKESIILNVIPATSDFATCGSIAMSKSVDQTGDRTLAVVTKSDIGAKGLHEKVATNVVKIKLGYVCVRNRIGDESFAEAREAEEKLFAPDPLLSSMDKSMVGIPALAKKLMELQAASIVKCFPEILQKIDETLNKYVAERKSMPPVLATHNDVMLSFLRVLGDAKEILQKILLRGEFEDFRDDKQMHCTARLMEMLESCYKDMKSKKLNADISSKSFLLEEISILEELKRFELTGFLPYNAFLEIIKKHIREVAHTPLELVQKAWSHIEQVIVNVLTHCSRNYPLLQSNLIEAAQTLILKMKEESCKEVDKLIEMEMLMGYTFDTRYTETYNKLMQQQNRFSEAMTNPLKYVDGSTKYVFQHQDFGTVDVEHLINKLVVAGQAFDLRMRTIAYWDVAVLRLADCLTFHFRYILSRLVNEFHEGVLKMMALEMNELQELLKEPSGASKKREELESKIAKLKKSKLIMIKGINCAPVTLKM